MIHSESWSQPRDKKDFLQKDTYPLKKQKQNQKPLCLACVYSPIVCLFITLPGRNGPQSSGSWRCSGHPGNRHAWSTKRTPTTQLLSSVVPQCPITPGRWWSQSTARLWQDLERALSARRRAPRAVRRARKRRARWPKLARRRGGGVSGASWSWRRRRSWRTTPSKSSVTLCCRVAEVSMNLQSNTTAQARPSDGGRDKDGKRCVQTLRKHFPWRLLSSGVRDPGANHRLTVGTDNTQENKAGKILPRKLPFEDKYGSH